MLGEDIDFKATVRKYNFLDSTICFSSDFRQCPLVEEASSGPVDHCFKQFCPLNSMLSIPIVLNRGLMVNSIPFRFVMLVTNSEFDKFECAEILKNAKIVITFDWDIQKLREEFDGGNASGASPAEKNLMSSKKKKLSRKEKKELMEKRKKIKEKLPECIVNIAENCFIDLVEELKVQKVKEFKNIFEEKSLVEELVEFGFERRICEDYYAENPKTTLD